MDAPSMMGFGAALLIGALLGIVGGGGAILTLPVLVYAFAMGPGVATMYSLFVVGTTSAIGAARYARDRLIDYGAAVRFALPAFVAIHLVRNVLVPRIPDTIALPGGASIFKDTLVVAVLVAAMLMSAYGMLRRKVLPTQSSERQSGTKARATRSMVRGFGVGLLTGFVGAGGGFLLVPALALVERLPMKRAVATSLFVIAANSLFGFATDLVAGRTVEWPFLLTFTGLASIGILIGIRIARLLTENRVRNFFGWFLVLIAAIVTLAETLK
jgi:uncharacterized membrane protein YfcA